jgi:hypothetical protein
MESAVPVGQAEDAFAGLDDLTAPRGLIRAADPEGGQGVLLQQAFE